jgi:hypothetical protein
MPFRTTRRLECPVPWPWILGGAAALGLGAAGVAGSFESSAAREIAGLLGPGARVRVRTRLDYKAIWGDVRAVTIEGTGFAATSLPLYTEPERSQASRLDRLEIRLSDFSLRGLRVRRMEATIPGCRYDRGLAWSKKRFRLSRSGVGRGWVEVGADDLAAFAARRYAAVRGLKIRFEGGRILLDGTADFLRVQTPFSVDAQVFSPAGSTVSLRDARVRLGGAEASPAATEAILRIVNPVLDFDVDLGLMGALRVERVTVDGETMRAEGAATIPTR